jgi:hypothetical protein
VDVDNRTPFATRLLRFQRPPESMLGVLVVKATFERAAGGHFVPSGEQVPFIDDRLETPFGMFHGDTYTHKDGVDLCVLGTLRTTRPVKSAIVGLALDAFQHELQVFGDRKWSRSGSTLVPSDAEPFTEMSIAYSRAYGGTTEHDGESVTWTDNPTGRGHYLSENGAIGQPLPNIEPGRGPFVREWSERPDVAGWGPYPRYWGMRAREGMDPPKGPDALPLPRVKPRLNNNAHPALVVPRVEPGSTLLVRGMRSREIRFDLPLVRPLAVVEVGDGVTEAHGRLDGVFAWLDADRLTLSHRIHFNYRFQKGERRIVRLLDSSQRK